MRVPPRSDAMLVTDPRQVLSDNLDAIRRIVRGVGRQRRLTAEEIEDLESALWIRLIEHDYRALRQYRGQASLTTFVRVVVTRLLFDLQAASGAGRWRPSTRARRLGAAGVMFERHLFRDGHTLDEALMLLRSAPDALTPGIRQLADVRRSMLRRFVPLDGLNAPIYDDPGAGLAAAERRVRARQVARALRHVLDTLSPRDRLLLELRYARGLKVSAMARVLRQDQKRLYRRLAKVYAYLRDAVERAGVTVHDARDVVGVNEVTMPAMLS